MTFPTHIDSARIMDTDFEIFTGRIVGRRISYYGREPYFLYKVQITNHYTLGTTKRYITIRTATKSSACGYRFNLGMTYLITTHRNHDEQSIRDTSVCVRNVLVSKAQDEIELIERVLSNSNE
ncbi:MAG: hypothetical protein IPM74_12675 [Crocinitomicaceae bacterium]|nr:hypothetical protein [Crocinitomicaceae bacterium]MBK8926729.1 hypothetical protein [Crocinitomicaceae bacterium]